MNSIGKLNVVVFFAEKFSSILFIWVGLALGLVIYDYTQVLYLATILVSFMSARDSTYIAKYQTIKVNKNNKVNQKFITNIIINDKFKEKIISRCFISFLISFFIITILNFFGLFVYLKIDSYNLLCIFLIYIFVENFSGLLLQYHRYKANILGAYQLRIIYLCCKILSFGVGIACENLVVSILVYAVLMFALLIWLTNVINVHWERVYNYFKSGFTVIKIKNLLLMGFIGLTSGIFVGFDRFVLPGYNSDLNYLEAFATLKFYLGFITFTIPFVGFWLSPAVSREIRLLNHTSQKLSKFINSLLLYIGFSVILFANIYYHLINGFYNEILNIKFIVILSLLCGITTLNLLLNVCFFNINTVYFSLYNSFIITILAIFFYIIGPSEIFLIYSGFIFCFGFATTGFMFRRFSNGMYRVVLFLSALYLILFAYITIFNFSFLTLSGLSLTMFIFILVREFFRKFENFFIFFKGL
jgi:hypothetical protein